MKDSIKREQNEFARYAERENPRTKCKEIIAGFLASLR